MSFLARDAVGGLPEYIPWQNSEEPSGSALYPEPQVAIFARIFVGGRYSKNCAAGRHLRFDNYIVLPLHENRVVIINVSDVDPNQYSVEDDPCTGVLGDKREREREKNKDEHKWT